MAAVMTESVESCKIMPAPKVGRPSKYNTRTARKAREYIQGKYKTIPTIAGLCVYLGVCRDTVYEWMKDESKKEFTDTISNMADLREELLLDGSLSGTLNSNISKLVLMTNHGYTENKDSGVSINVTVARDQVKISHKDQQLSVDTGTTYEHKE